MAHAKSQKIMVVKVGSSSLTDDIGQLHLPKLEHLVEQLCHIQQAGLWQIVLVSSGAVAAGVSQLGWQAASITMPEKQAAAAVGQGILIDMYAQLFRRKNVMVGQILLTRSDIEDRHRFVHIRNTITTLLKHDIIPIVNENDTVAVEEIRFGDNDTLASLVAMVVEADTVVLLTDIDGLYTGNPRQDPSAQRIPDVWQITPDVERMAGDAGSAVGTGGMRTKIGAAKMAVESGIDLIIAASGEENVLLRIGQGESIGTHFHASVSPASSRKVWLTHGTRADGKIVIDDGATEALLHKSGSLLMPGIARVDGDFDTGAIVDLVALSGTVLGRGIVSFTSSDLRDFLRRRSAGEKLNNLPTVIHRNDLVMLRGDMRP